MVKNKKKQQKKIKTTKSKVAKAKSRVKKPAAKKPAAKKPAAKKLKNKSKAKTRITKKIPKKTKGNLKKTTKTKKIPLQYSIGDFIVYPSHGVGEITSIQTFEIAEEKLEMYNVIFEKEKMTLKIPTIKAKEIGIRKVSSKANLKKTLEILNGKAKIRRTMWSRRAQEYESKNNSGSLSELTEVVRDLFRNSNQPEQSYS